MDFKQAKLSKEAEGHLRICPIQSVQPYALMMAPAYVYMKLNEKFVMVKSAFDFFTEEEKERLTPLGSLYFPEQVETALRFRSVASQVRELLRWNPEALALHELKESIRGKKEEIPLLPASFELSDAVIRLLSQLWEPGPFIDPFYVAVFSNELLELIPSELLKGYRDQSVVNFEKAVMFSSWAAFISLHLGYTDLDFLNRLRNSVFNETMTGMAGNWRKPEIRQIISAARESLGASVEPYPGSYIHFEVFKTKFGATSQKLKSRGRRLEGVANG
jgi:hypothetical protein